ncbi:MAG: L-aspartate oxidase [Candidatus Aureabacteria bacterium]|nr:L-aspartate oxidase [Candidatus Auribacterota bacterium]
MNPRYLVNFKLSELSRIKTDVVVVGSGSAGLVASLEAAKYGKVIIVTKSGVEESNTYHAQGGIAVSLSKNDTWKKHFEDTIFAGAGLCNKTAVKILVREGIERVKEIMALGAKFDKDKGGLLFGREGAHSENRIIHANGDNTGEEIEKTLIRAVKKNPNIRILEKHFVIDLLHYKSRCYGVIVFDNRSGRQFAVVASSTIVATGGAGQIYRETTNPEIATADGIAFAFRAGAVLMDMEFMQFHPTTLYLAGAPRFLISEAVRGEGGILVDKRNKHFMKGYHYLEDLAPRDIVSRAIVEQMKKTSSNCVYLDLSKISAAKVSRRFPSIKKICKEYGLNIPKDKIPVRPSAHYMMGGIKTDTNGCTNIDGLFACGEVSCSGVQGANRLASNSLLESLVFGTRTGKAAASHSNKNKKALPDIKYYKERKLFNALDVDDVKRSLQSVMWMCIGLERNKETLEEALNIISFWEKYTLSACVKYVDGFELQDMLMIARIMISAAIKRKESRGAHFRTDFPKQSDKWKRHITCRLK